MRGDLLEHHHPLVDCEKRLFLGRIDTNTNHQFGKQLAGALNDIQVPQMYGVEHARIDSYFGSLFCH